MKDYALIWWAEPDCDTRCNYREQYRVHIMPPEIIDKLYKLYA